MTQYKSLRYNTSDASSMIETRRRANYILLEYIKEGSDRQVNIPFEMKKEIENNVSKGNINLSTFDRAYNEIINLMSKDSFARYKKSQLCLKYIVTLSSRRSSTRGLSISQALGFQTLKKNENLSPKMSISGRDSPVNNKKSSLPSAFELKPTNSNSKNWKILILYIYQTCIFKLLSLSSLFFILKPL